MPPKRRVVEASAWEKDSNRRPWSFSAIPMPVSITSNRSRARSRSPLSMATLRITSPVAVNLTAFDTRFSRI